MRSTAERFLSFTEEAAAAVSLESAAMHSKNIAAAFVVSACHGAVCAPSSSSSWTCRSRPTGGLAPAHRQRALQCPASTLSPSCSASVPGNDTEEDDVLDVTAMRAAEIHEVLEGLQEFRQRIIDGICAFSRDSKVTVFPLKVIVSDFSHACRFFSRFFCDGRRH